MASARKVDENGFMSVKACPISSHGIFDYSAAQLGLPGDPDRIVKVFRPEEEVNNPKTIESFKIVPFIIDHEMLSGFDGDEEAEAPEDYGIDGVLTDVYYDNPWLRGDLKIFSRKAQKALRSGKKELSLGYGCDFEEKPGVYKGQPYEVVQKNMRGNHIALVDKARVPGARVLDGLCFDSLSFTIHKTKESSMAYGRRKKALDSRRRKAADNAVEQLKALLPALEQFLNEEATEPAHQGGEEGEENPELNQHEATGSEEGENEEMEDGDELHELVAEAEHLISRLKESLGTTESNEHREGEDEEEEEGENRHEGEDRRMKDRHGKDRRARDREEGEDNEHEGEDEHGEREGEDALSGLQEEGSHALGADGEGRDIPQNGGKAPAGPSAGRHAEAGDAALRRFYADSAAKDRLYKRLSPIVGAFDHSAMDARSVAAYGLKKLGIKARAGAAMDALDAYLTAHERATKKVRNEVRRSIAGDSAVGDSGEMTPAFAAWVNGDAK